MTEPSATPPAPPRARRSSVRWIERGTLLILGVAVAAVGIVAVPAVFRAAGATRAEPRAPFIVRSSADRGRATNVAPQPSDEPDDDAIDDVPQARTRVGLARRPLVLLSRAADGSRVTGHVDEGEVVVVLQEIGDWVYVMRDASQTGSGWTRKSGIAVR